MKTNSYKNSPKTNPKLEYSSLMFLLAQVLFPFCYFLINLRAPYSRIKTRILLQKSHPMSHSKISTYIQLHEEILCNKSLEALHGTQPTFFYLFDLKSLFTTLSSTFSLLQSKSMSS